MFKKRHLFYYKSMAKRSPFRQFLRDNGLVLCMFGLFAVFLVGLSITGYVTNNQDLQAHKQPVETYTTYLGSGGFMEAVFENWESEFLQMAALVIATIFLYQKGAADSRKLHGTQEFDTSSRFSIIHAASWKRKKKALKETLYANSLSIALVSLFLISFALHAMGGTAAHNDEAVYHNESSVAVIEYVRTSQFWYESFQNWQSEFLAVGTLLLLSVYLRQRHSPESKPVGENNQATGE
jgi:hypothetical protein